MSNMVLDQTALTEADAARAANNDGKEIAMEDEDSSENDEELVDYNEQLVALKETLTNNGHTLREILRTEKVKAHYVSPFSEENTMSIEDILQEIPKEDLHEVWTVRDRIFMPASFVQKWIIPTIRARNALKVVVWTLWAKDRLYYYGSRMYMVAVQGKYTIIWISIFIYCA